jgi:hypothetical protein
MLWQRTKEFLSESSVMDLKFLKCFATFFSFIFSLVPLPYFQFTFFVKQISTNIILLEDPLPDNTITAHPKFIQFCNKFSKRAGLWYPSSRVQTRPNPSDFSVRKNPQRAFLRKESKTVDPMSLIYGM